MVKFNEIHRDSRFQVGLVWRVMVLKQKSEGFLSIVYLPRFGKEPEMGRQFKFWCLLA